MTLMGFLTTGHRQTEEPVFAGTTVSVERLFEALAAGRTLDQFLEDYPTVDRDQVLAVLEAARRLIVETAPPAEGETSPDDAAWPPEILRFQGDPELPAFESYRDELPPPRDDPFS